jgi:adenylate cyclase
MADKSKGRTQFISAVIIFLGTLLFAALMELIPWLAQVERVTYDSIFSIRRHLTPSPEVVVIAMDESSQKEIGPIPWSRGVHAALLRKLKEMGARVAVFDVLFDLPQPKDPQTGYDGDQDFASAIHEFGNVVLGRDLSRTSDPQYSLEQTIDPLPIFTDAGATPAFVTTPADPDMKIRRSAWSVNGETTLATEAYKIVHGESFREDGNKYYLGDRRVPVDSPDARPTFLINFTGPTHTIPTRSYYQVLDGTLPAGFVKDKVVFIGADLKAENRTGGPVTDQFPTPVDIEGVFMPGVEIHANAYNTLVTKAFVRTASAPLIWTALILFAVITTLYCNLLRPVPAGLATAGTVLLAGIAVFFIFIQYNFFLPSIRPVVMIGLIYTGSTMVQYRLAQRERAQISRAFKHYVSVEVLGELMKNPESLGLGGREVEATVLFTDIAGFSKISEKITPQELTQMLNNYFELLAGVVMREGGMVNKFIGDAIMALWGVPLENPNHAIQACRASLQMHRAMQTLDPMKVRIGINTGRMIAGNLGSRERFEYTVIGDAVNLASRLEGVNKPYQTDVMISEMTEEKVRGHFLLREVDSIRVIGKQKPVRIYQLLDTVENKEAPEHQRWSEMTDSFMPCIEAYKNRQWEMACGLFNQHCLLFPEDPVGRIYRERCRAFLLQPPVDDWDGVYQMETK